MTYIIVENRLVLHEMSVTVEDLKENPPLINCVNPEIKDEGILHLTYKNLKHKIKFTGKILVAKDFIDSMYVHMGFQSPLSFKTVIELRISDGILIKVANFSNIMRDYRKLNISDGKLKPSDDLQAWIARTFSLDYDF